MAAMLSAVLLVVGASATFSSLSAALDVVFHAEPKRGVRGLALLVRARLVSFGLMWGVSFLLLVSLALDASINFAGQLMFGNSRLLAVAAVAQTLFRLLVLGAAFTALLRWLPNAPVQFSTQDLVRRCRQCCSRSDAACSDCIWRIPAR
jgi:membrane protein